jgi:DNA mismatch endonuclease (patch repair protein)
MAKINRNRELDKMNVQKLDELGWQVVEIFECDLRDSKKQRTILNLINQLKKTSNGKSS